MRQQVTNVEQLIDIMEKRRNHLGITQYELEKRAGTSKSSYHNLRKKATLETSTALKILEGLGIQTILVDSEGDVYFLRSDSNFKKIIKQISNIKSATLEKCLGVSQGYFGRHSNMKFEIFLSSLYYIGAKMEINPFEEEHVEYWKFLLCLDSLTYQEKIDAFYELAESFIPRD